MMHKHIYRYMHMQAYPNFYCDLNLIPTILFKDISSAIIVPVILAIVNLFLSLCTFPIQFKTFFVSPLLKKPSLDKKKSS